LLKVEASSPLVLNWFNVIIATFLVGAATGGVLFGWLGDRIGRVRAMSFSVFAYAIFTGLCGFATEAWHVAGLRFIASLGVGGEWALGVALVNELWTSGNRAWIAGLIGAAANVGCLLVALLSLGLVSFIAQTKGFVISLGVSQAAAESWFSHGGWRFRDGHGRAAGTADLPDPDLCAGERKVAGGKGLGWHLALEQQRPAWRSARAARWP